MCQRIIREFELDILVGKQVLVLAGQGILGFEQNPFEAGDIQILQEGNHREASNEFGNQAKLKQVIRLQCFEQLRRLSILIVIAECGIKANTRLRRIQASFHQLGQTRKSAADDKQNVTGIQHHFFTAFATTALRHPEFAAFDHFQQRLLHPFTGHITYAHVG